MNLSILMIWMSPFLVFGVAGGCINYVPNYGEVVGGHISLGLSFRLSVRKVFLQLGNTKTAYAIS